MTFDKYNMEEAIKKVENCLYQMDPMNTCCVENEVYDEYHKVAVYICGYSLRLSNLTEDDVYECSKTVFFMEWWDSCVTEQKLKEISYEIFKLIGVYQRPPVQN